MTFEKLGRNKTQAVVHKEGSHTIRKHFSIFKHKKVYKLMDEVMTENLPQGPDGGGLKSS